MSIVSEETKRKMKGGGRGGGENVGDGREGKGGKRKEVVEIDG